MLPSRYVSVETIDSPFRAFLRYDSAAPAHGRMVMMTLVACSRGGIMPEPITMSIAAALVGGVSAALSDGTRALVTKLGSLVRERLRRNASDDDLLESMLRAPPDDTSVRRLAELLDQRMREDPQLAGELRSAWREVAAAMEAEPDSVANRVNGPVHGSVVQARDVQGGITFHHPLPPPPRRPGR